ncbi:MAG: DUF350 domain-containing protein [Planctomycetes bacterium]|nr:DUF350 domain-containing protein [Planctomycetota bacterium]
MIPTTDFFLTNLFPVLVQANDATHPASSGPNILGALLGLLMGVVQLVVGLSIAAFAINKGFQIVSGLLSGIEIWAEVKKRNAAVALLAAGVVISYTNVIAGGIAAMTTGLQNLVSGELSAGVGAVIGGALNLIVAIMVASFAITVTFKVMDKLTNNINEKDEFKNGNIAIGIVYAGILIGVSGLISAGVSGIGAAVTSFLSALLEYFNVFS